MVPPVSCQTPTTTTTHTLCPQPLASETPPFSGVLAQTFSAAGLFFYFPQHSCILHVVLDQAQRVASDCSGGLQALLASASFPELLELALVQAPLAPHPYS